MYYLQDPGNEDILIKTNDRQFANALAHEHGYVILPMWKQRIADAFLNLLAFAVAGLVPALVLRLAIGYPEWLRFVPAGIVGAIVYDFLKKYVV